MNAIDLTPLYRNTIGFDRFANLINNTLSSESTPGGSYPPYNIEVLKDNQYTITLAIAGFTEDELTIQTEKGVLTVRGKQSKKESREYLYRGISNRSFERTFNLADFVEVIGADLSNGLLTLQLKKEIPEAMKPKVVSINGAATAEANKDS